jgi:hypothetical protein
MILLRDYLSGVYGGQRINDCSLDLHIKIDNQSRNDVSNLFCQMFVQITEREADSFVLIMRNAPLSSTTKDLIEQHGGELTREPLGTSVTLQLELTSITFIRKLATTIRNTVGRGKRYADRNWKWTCGRTAKSLDRLADELKAFRKERRSKGGCVRGPLNAKGAR